MLTGRRLKYSGSGRVAFSARPGEGRTVRTPNPPWVAEGGVHAAKRLAVSTGRLRRSPALHFRPIDLVVYQEPSPLRAGDLVLRGASRLDAFSVYPGRT